jgi:cell division protein FtsB
MTFFDRNNFLFQHENIQKLNQLEAEKTYYLEQIAQNEANLNELLTNQETLEKFARETYLMKKPNEEIFVIIQKPKLEEETFWKRVRHTFSTWI